MKKIYVAGLVSLLFIFVFSYSTQAQAYRKGSLLISVSEGSTWAHYTTNNILANDETTPTTHGGGCTGGTRDPFIIEYGLSKRWSIGLTSGADIFKVKSANLYGFGEPDQTIKVTTGEFTIDCGYHVFVNKRLDLSVSTSVGMFSTGFNESTSDVTTKYKANGNIIRFGTRARYYFFRRLGAFGMASTYFANSSPKDVKANTVANTYSTKINGFALEAGLCFRILK
jgi:hypothetical protein